MHPNFLFIPTLLGAAFFGVLGFKASSAPRPILHTAVCSLIAALLALPALLFAAYYGHIFDQTAWFYTFRAAPDTELTAAGLGFGAGFISQLKRRPFLQRSAEGRLAVPTLVLLCAGILMVPYVKPIAAPLEELPPGQWKQGVAIQTTLATCGPASAATLLRQFNIAASERDLARECFSYRGGTENWYVARALQRHGLRTQYRLTAAQPATLPVPSLAGVQFGGPGTGGHFITLLGRRGDSYIVGDPLVGKLVLTPARLRSRYYFTGFFLVVSKA